jgi:hypothetical protein
MSDPDNLLADLQDRDNAGGEADSLRHVSELDMMLVVLGPWVEIADGTAVGCLCGEGELSVGRFRNVRHRHFRTRRSRMRAYMSALALSVTHMRCWMQEISEFLATTISRAAQMGVFDLDIRISNRLFIDVCTSCAAETGLNSRNVEKRINAV